MLGVLKRVFVVAQCTLRSLRGPLPKLNGSGQRDRFGWQGRLYTMISLGLVSWVLNRAPAATQSVTHASGREERERERGKEQRNRGSRFRKGLDCFKVARYRADQRHRRSAKAHDVSNFVELHQQNFRRPDRTTCQRPIRSSRCARFAHGLVQWVWDCRVETLAYAALSRQMPFFILRM